MATLTPTRPGAGGLVPDPPRIIRVGPGERPMAIARLLGVHPQDRETIGMFASQADSSGTDLSQMWASVRAPAGPQGVPQITQVCLAIVNPGRTAVMLVSSGLPEGVGGSGEYARARLERAAAIDEACRQVRNPLASEGASGIVLAQALLETDESDLIASFEGAGFFRLADLAYMRRPIPHAAADATRPVRLPTGIEVQPVSALPAASADAHLRRALEGSYEQTLDCPDLCGMRSVEDVIDSHRAVGIYDPGLWFLVLQGGRAEGCMLLSAGASEDTVELVYLGLAPAVRGKGLGAALLAVGLTRLAERSESTLACAVDTRNTPALRLYRRAGFRRFAARAAMVRSLRSAATS